MILLFVRTAKKKLSLFNTAVLPEIIALIVFGASTLMKMSRGTENQIVRD